MTYVLKILRTNTSAGGKMSDLIKHLLAKAKENKTDFNSKPFLLGFDNGVYDLEADLFRPYEYDDYMTMSVTYDYAKPNYEDEDIKKAKDDVDVLIATIQPVKVVRELFLIMLASTLDGILYQFFFLLNGEGGNGKGTIALLISIILGDYYCQPSNGILKDVEKSNAPSPDLVGLKGKRYINFKEVQGSIKGSVLRNLTGGGKFVGRNLHENNVEFSIGATISMEFNEDPDFEGKIEEAEYRRALNIHFPVNFTNDTSKIGKEINGVQFKKADSKYEDHEYLHTLKLVFLDTLLDVYRKNFKHEVRRIVFNVPDIVRARTDKFLQNQSIFKRVFDQKWIAVEDSDETQKVHDLWDSIRRSDEYKKLTSREQRNYGRDEFYKWVKKTFEVEECTEEAKKALLAKGIVLRDESDF